MTVVRNWLQTHSISSHTIAVAWITATALWASDPAFKNYVWGIYAECPKSVHDFVAGILIPLLVYWQAKKRLPEVKAAKAAKD